MVICIAFGKLPQPDMTVNHGVLGSILGRRISNILFFLIFFNLNNNKMNFEELLGGMIHNAGTKRVMKNDCRKTQQQIHITWLDAHCNVARPLLQRNVGDPFKSDERTLLSIREIEYNQDCIKKTKIIDFETPSENIAEILNNYTWTKDWTFLDFIKGYR